MRVVIADDVMLVRSGVARLLTEAGVEIVGEAGDAEELLRLVAIEQPDVAVVDIRMPPTHTDEGLVAAAIEPRPASWPAHTSCRPMSMARCPLRQCWKAWPLPLPAMPPLNRWSRPSRPATSLASKNLSRNR